MAQDGYREYLNILTEKILGNEKEIEIDFQSANLSLGDEPIV